jgi:hypothetical protein
MLQNDLCQELPVRVKTGDKVIVAPLQADSFNRFVLRTSCYTEGAQGF